MYLFISNMYTGEPIFHGALIENEFCKHYKQIITQYNSS